MIKTVEAEKGCYIEQSTHELMFLGHSGQPYRGVLGVQYTTNNKAIEAISLKKYIETLRRETMLLENSAKIIHDNINTVLQSDTLCVTVRTTPRGGVSSTVKYGYTEFKDIEIKPIVFGV